MFRHGKSFRKALEDYEQTHRKTHKQFFLVIKLKIHVFLILFEWIFRSDSRDNVDNINYFSECWRMCILPSSESQWKTWNLNI